MQPTRDMPPDDLGPSYRLLRDGSGQVVRVTVSAGVAACAHPASDVHALILRADTRMCRAKHAGRDRIAIELEDGSEAGCRARAGCHGGHCRDPVDGRSDCIVTIADNKNGESGMLMDKLGNANTRHVARFITRPAAVAIGLVIVRNVRRTDGSR